MAGAAAGRARRDRDLPHGRQARGPAAFRRAARLPLAVAARTVRLTPRPAFGLPTAARRIGRLRWFTRRLCAARSHSSFSPRTPAEPPRRRRAAPGPHVRSAPAATAGRPPLPGASTLLEHPLARLGWRADLQTDLDALGDPGLVPARVAAVDRGSVVVDTGGRSWSAPLAGRSAHGRRARDRRLRRRRCPTGPCARCCRGAASSPVAATAAGRRCWRPTSTSRSWPRR